MKRVAFILLIIGILIGGSISINAKINKIGMWHSGNELSISINGAEKSLSTAIINNLFRGTNIYTNSAIPNPGHFANEIWISVNGNEKNLSEALSVINGLCGNTQTISYLNKNISKSVHLANEIEIVIGKSFQDYIDEGNLCCAAPDYGTSCESCGGTILCDGTCSVSTPTNFGDSCGSCGGTILCDGTCSVSTPTNFGDSCGGNTCTDAGIISCNGACEGTSIKPTINGGWSSWKYGRCGFDCEKTGTRTCTNPAPSCGGTTCNGISRKDVSCTGESCRPCKPNWQPRSNLECPWIDVYQEDGCGKTRIISGTKYC